MTLEKVYKWLGKSVLGTLIVGVVLVLLRIVAIALAWFGGKVVEWIFGGYISNGVNALFPHAHFHAGLIPAAAVLLYVAGSWFFQASHETSTKVD